MPVKLPCIALLVKLGKEFDQNLGVTFSKPSTSGLKLYFLMLSKHLKFENLGIKSRA